jgi:hypothetical protein
MSGIVGKKVSLGQAKGGDVDLIVTGTELYATYETPDGYPAIYDAAAGLFCFARLVGGRFVSTGVPVTSAPPPGVERHARESDDVRSHKIAQRQSEMERRSHLADAPARSKPERG